MLRTFTTVFVIILIGTNFSFAQNPKRDTGKLVEKKNDFFEKITSENEKFAEVKKEPKMKFIVNFDGMDLPESKDDFTSYWHNDPISQGNSGMCWSYCTTSLMESEVYRLHGKKIKLSELYTVYYEYVEKARRFVREHGDSYFEQGSLGNHIPTIWKKYGIVPADAYTGLEENEPFHNHDKLFEEMNSYLKFIKQNNIWNEEEVLNNIKSILNYHIGTPPSEITVDGKKMTPLEYFKNVVKINFDDYINLLSLMEKPYNQFVEYPVPDNWWKSDDFYNIELDTFMKIIKNAIRKGYTLTIGGDVGEPGLWAYKDVAIVPTFDIPSDYIDENARQLRFSNGSTTDDHGIHLVGYQEQNGVDWFLIKDSGSGSRNGANKGYYFYHEDYIKLKMMDCTVHKDAVKDFINF